MTEPNVKRHGAEERNSISNKHRYANDNQTLNEPGAQETLNRDPTVDIEVVGPTRGESRDDLRRVPAISSTTPPMAADKSTGRLLRTATRLWPYGKGPRVNTFSNVLRPTTIASTLAMN
jgi:hypothetical protein